MEFNHGSVQIKAGRSWTAIPAVAEKRQSQPGHLSPDLMPEPPRNTHPAFDSGSALRVENALSIRIGIKRKDEAPVEPFRRSVRTSPSRKGLLRAETGDMGPAGPIGPEAAGRFEGKTDGTACAARKSPKRILPFPAGKSAGSAHARFCPRQAPFRLSMDRTAEQIFLAYPIFLLLGAQSLAVLPVQSKEHQARSAIIDPVYHAAVHSGAGTGSLGPALKDPFRKALAA